MDTYYKSLQNQWKTDQHCSLKLFNVQVRSLSEKETSKRCLNPLKQSKQEEEPFNIFDIGIVISDL